jgi:hypothetical protein
MFLGIKKLLSKFLFKTIRRELLNLENEVLRLIPRTILNFGVHLTEHCNLNCWACDHFSPIAGQKFADIDVFESDFARLSDLLHGEALRIALMGGEPLLHPEIEDFLYVARKHFPKASICIVSNGLLLLNKGKLFWQACKENNIILEITKYPIKLDFGEMKKVADNFCVTLKFYNNTGNVQKMSSHIPLDLAGEQDARRNFMRCYHANSCIFLSKGRLYTCTVAPNIGHFNKYFNVDIPTSARNSIDIYQARNAQEILEFLSNPIPFCRYCYVEKRTSGHPWKKSNKEITEWTV